MSNHDVNLLYIEIQNLEEKMREIQNRYFDKTLNLSEESLHKIEDEMKNLKKIINEKEEILLDKINLSCSDAKVCLSPSFQEYSFPPSNTVKKRIIPVNIDGEPIKKLGHSKWSK
jgi:hypothetical protein